MSSEFYSGRRVLVTGASGFIGSACTRRLLALGAEVTGAGRSVDPGSLSWRRGDLANVEFCRELVAAARPEVVLHLAGRTSAGNGLEHVLPSLQANVVGTVNLLTALAERRPQVRFVYSSSMEEPFRDYPGFGSAYGVSKWVGTAYTRLFRELYAMPALCLRPMFVYGPGLQPADKLVAHLVGEFLGGGTPALKSPGRGMDWVFVDDVVNAFLLAGAGSACPAVPLDLGTGKLTSIGEVAALIARAAGSETAEIALGANDRGREGSPVADVATTHRELGWRAATPLPDGIEATVAWYQQQRLAGQTRHQGSG